MSIGTDSGWDEYWQELSPSQQNLWNILGENQKTWDEDIFDAPRMSFCFDDGNEEQKNAVLSLCIEPDQWNADMFAEYELDCRSGTNSTASASR